MSTRPWLTPDVKDRIASMKGTARPDDVARLFDVSLRSVNRIWGHLDHDTRYHPWCIVSDPSDRAVVRVAYMMERHPDDLGTPDDLARMKILRAIRALGPEAVASLIPSDPPQAS